ncbi:hypothetical protein HKX42_00040 [Salinisphaera sp. USBA-960]|nr:hypothetical protein [Salifodinibacter halophilus]NNC25281.1 hypothetical protein [Salifodinibacter halophilus]
MYGDPKRVRQPYARINLDDYERKLLDALVDYTGVERASLLRHLVIKEALDVLGVEHENSLVDEFDRRQA